MKMMVVISFGKIKIREEWDFYLPGVFDNVGQIDGHLAQVFI